MEEVLRNVSCLVWYLFRTKCPTFPARIEYTRTRGVHGARGERSTPIYHPSVYQPMPTGETHEQNHKLQRGGGHYLKALHTRPYLKHIQLYHMIYLDPFPLCRNIFAQGHAVEQLLKPVHLVRIDQGLCPLHVVRHSRDREQKKQLALLSATPQVLKELAGVPSVDLKPAMHMINYLRKHLCC